MNSGAAAPIADRAIADLVTLQASIVREVQRSLLHLDTKPGSDALVKSIATNSTVVRQIDATLVGAGLRSTIETLNESVKQAITGTLGEANFAVSAQREIGQIVREDQRELAALFGDAVDKISRAIALGSTSSASLFDLTEAVAKQIEITFARARSLVDTAIMSAGRVAVFAAVEDAGLADNIVYYYSGPQDAVTRPFCSLYTGKALAMSAIKQLDNGQGVPVEQTCGGYNCRHTWSPITPQEAQRQGIPVLR